MAPLFRSMLLMIAITTCASPSAASVRFACQVEGEALLSPAMPATEVCARVRARIDDALGVATSPVDAVPEAAEASDWVRVELRFARPGVASARLFTARGGKITDYPEFNIAVSDRPLGADTVDALATTLAQQLRTVKLHQG